MGGGRAGRTTGRTRLARARRDDPDALLDPTEDPGATAFGALGTEAGLGDRRVVGRQITMNQIPYTVIGVAPRGFTGVFGGVRCDFWAPISMAERLGNPGMLTSRGSHGLFAFGRL
ncbi:MAG TPA: hypothetical protein PLS29_02290, partial [Acidimicrobiales bacterium]|nr:hypothetical protein [Acidimicrobiales bacterium]